jgi:hypothetical protein
MVIGVRMEFTKLSAVVQDSLPSQGGLRAGSDSNAIHSAGNLRRLMNCADRREWIPCKRGLPAAQLAVVYCRRSKLPLAGVYKI